MAGRQAIGAGVPSVRPARKRAQAIAKGRGREHRVIIPLAFEVAARISARPPDAFRNDPTQLANGLGDLQRAIDADGIVVALAGEMELESSAGQGLDAAAIAAVGPVAASLEACVRLRQTLGDHVALLAGLTGPATLARQFDADPAAANDCFSALVKAFCGAGTDVIILFEDDDAMEDETWKAGIKTSDNIARFHQACLLAWHEGSLPVPVKQPFAAPSMDGLGFITTDVVVADDADIEMLRDWVAQTRGER